MTREEALEAMCKGWPVKVFRPGRPKQHYICRVIREMPDGTFYLVGNSGSEEIRVRKKSDDFSLDKDKLTAERRGE